MICNAPRLSDQLHYYLAYFADHDPSHINQLEISLNGGQARLVTPEIRLIPGQSPALDYVPSALTPPQARLLSWLGLLLGLLAEERAECKIRIRIDPMRDQPYEVIFRLHRPLHGATRT